MLYLNNNPVDVTLFPDNTSQVWKIPNLDIIKTAHIRWEFQHEGEIMHLAQLKDLLDTLGLVTYNLHIKYLPYARQDKNISNETTFALTSFARILNNMRFDEVMIHDPHSSIALDLIHNSGAEYSSIVEDIYQDLNIDIVAFPDAGAVKKYSLIYEYPHVMGNKVRDQLTGNILSYDIYNPSGVSCKDKKILIIDDICDGGGTFVLLANELYKAGAKDVNLFVSHGIFSKGLKPLSNAKINRVFTSDGEVSEVQNNICYKQL